MRCDRVRFLYDEYSQGTLPVSTLGRVEEHLAGCPACREVFDQNDAIAALVRKSTEVAHPGPQYFEDLHSSVLAALDHPAAENIPDPAEIIDIPSTQWRRPLWWFGGMAAAALLGVAMLPGIMTRPAAHNGAVAQRHHAKETPPPAAVFAQAPPPAQQAAPAGQAPAQVATLPTPPQSLDKSAIAGSQQTLASIINNKYDLDDDRDGPSEVEKKAIEETKARVASLREKAQNADTMPPEVFRQLQLLRTQVIEGGNEDLRRSLRELETLIDPLVSDQVKINAYPLVKQANLYVRANDDLGAGRTQEAMVKYSQILFVDDGSPVAIKAELQMADLFYGELANFSEARKYYQLCQGEAAKSVLNTYERKHVASQLERLEHYKADNWQALNLLHKVYQGKWNEVQSALRTLTAMGGTATLLPEAANAIVNRLESSEDAPTNDITLSIYKTLANKAKMEQNGDVRAWLELAAGDIAFGQFQDSPAALEHYGKAAAGGTSDAAVRARAKLDQIRNETLAGLVRNRKP